MKQLLDPALQGAGPDAGHGDPRRKLIVHWRPLLKLASGVLVLALGSLVSLADDYMSPVMTPAEVKARLGTPRVPRLVDLRTPPEFAIAHLPGAVNIPIAELEKRLDEVRPAEGQDLVIYCLDGNRTRQAEPILYANTIDNFYHLGGSLEGWLQKNYPIEKGGVTRKTW
jgi:rhodanese-related sulfurtransferase